MGRSGGAVAGLSLLVLLSACVHGHRPAPAARDDAGGGGTIDKAGKIVTQPVRDVGIGEPEVPPVLEQATADTYGLTGLKSCAQIASSSVMACWGLTSTRARKRRKIARARSRRRAARPWSTRSSLSAGWCARFPGRRPRSGGSMPRSMRASPGVVSCAASPKAEGVRATPTDLAVWRVNSPGQGW